MKPLSGILVAETPITDVVSNYSLLYLILNASFSSTASGYLDPQGIF